MGQPDQCGRKLDYTPAAPITERRTKPMRGDVRTLEAPEHHQERHTAERFVRTTPGEYEFARSDFPHLGEDQLRFGGPVGRDRQAPCSSAPSGD